MMHPYHKATHSRIRPRRAMPRPAFAMLLLAAVTTACTETPDIAEAEQHIRQACGASGPDLESTVVALLTVRKHATDEDRLRSDQFLESAHHAMLAEPKTYPVLQYAEALLTHPRFTTLVGIANGNLRTANRLDTAEAAPYLELAACMYRLARRYDAEVREHADDPQHAETLYALDSTLQCVEAKIKAPTGSRPHCLEAYNPSLPPRLLEQHSPRGG